MDTGARRSVGVPQQRQIRRWERIAVLDTLKRLQRDRNITMVLVSHDLGVIRTMADRVLVMRHGAVVEQGLGGEWVLAGTGRTG